MAKETTKTIMLLGESKTGKTAFINHLFKNRQFIQEHYPTVGVQAGVKTLEFENGSFAVVQIWDSAGKHDLHEYVCQKFYKEMNGFIIMIDLSNSNTLTSVNYWNEKIKTEKGSSKGYIVGVIANKADLEHHEFGQNEFRKMYPDMKFYREISLKQKIQGKRISPAQQAIYEFVKLLYDNNLPVLSTSNEAQQAGCKCNLM